MTKVLSYAVGVLLLALYIAISLYIGRGREIEALKGERNALIGKTSYLEAEIEKRNEKALAADKRLQTLERAAEAEKNKGGFDWDSPLPSDTVTLRLRQD